MAAFVGGVVGVLLGSAHDAGFLVIRDTFLEEICLPAREMFSMTIVSMVLIIVEEEGSTIEGVGGVVEFLVA